MREILSIAQTFILKIVERLSSRYHSNQFWQGVLIFAVTNYQTHVIATKSFRKRCRRVAKRIETTVHLRFRRSKSTSLELKPVSNLSSTEDTKSSKSMTLFTQ